MYAAMAKCVDRLDGGGVDESVVLGWGCPVPFFGELGDAEIATVGINPSNREFVGPDGGELSGDARRLPTLSSLGLTRWSETNALHLRDIVQACSRYFRKNPYDRWFGVLERILGGTPASFYDSKSPACHLDLVPYATSTKWGGLNPATQRQLLDLTGDTLGVLIRDAPVRVLVLNGRSVVRQFEYVADQPLKSKAVADWTLPRSGRDGVEGVAYRGAVTTVGGVELGRSVKVLGYNHNLQSSFGVTSEVIDAIGCWVGREASRT